MHTTSDESDEPDAGGRISRTPAVGRSGDDIGDWRDIYTALDRAKTTGTAIGTTVSDPKWAPKLYSHP